MIINTGMRTDIPAFYAEWFINRLKEGYVYTRNPYYPEQVTKYRLTPDVVDILVFCTKDPRPMLPHMDVLAPYGQYWFVTITPYGRDIEPGVPDKAEVMESFKKLSDVVGVDSMGWRYDPILITDKYTVEWHVRQFEEMAMELSGYTNSCVISFIDIYRKVQRNFPEAETVKREDRIRIGREFVRLAQKYDMVLRPCAEGEELAVYGADCGGCMTKAIFEKAIHGTLDVPKLKSQRSTCACLMGKDIGQYDTCGHLCKYCYANSDENAVKENRKRHDPKSPFLIGGLQDGDRVHEARQKSWADNQMKLF